MIVAYDSHTYLESMLMNKYDIVIVYHNTVINWDNYDVNTNDNHGLSSICGFV